MGSVFTSSDRAGGEGVKLSLSVDDPKLPPPFPFVVKLIVSFKLLLLLFTTLLFVLSVLLLFPAGDHFGGQIEFFYTWLTKLTVGRLDVHAIRIFDVRRKVVDVLDVGREIRGRDLGHVVDDI